MPETRESARDAAREMVAWQFRVLRKLYAQAAEITADSPSAEIGAVHKALMETAKGQRDFQLTIAAMRAIWDEAYALGRADERTALTELDAAPPPQAVLRAV